MRAILIITILLFSFNVQSQKKELRKIDKLVLESFFEEAKDALESSKSLILSSEDKYRAQYYFYDAKVSNELKMYENAISSLNNLLSINESVYPTKVEQEYKNLSIIISNGIVNGAVNDNKEGNFLDAAEKLIMAYNMDTEQYVDYLYFAAGSAVNGKDYEKSLKYYLELKNKGYTGIVDEFFVTNNETGQEEKVSQTEYDLLKSSKEYSNPRIGQTESRFPEIVKNIALIYVQQGQNELAEEAIKEARAIQPDDVSLLLNEADLYIRISNNSDNDDESFLNKIASKVSKLRIFNDEFGKMNKNINDINGEILLVSQFTLYADTKKGNRPSFIKAAKPENAIKIYNSFIKELQTYIKTKIQTGKFGADMKINLINDGPVTIILEN